MKGFVLGLLLFVVPSLASAEVCENAYRKFNRTLIADLGLNTTRSFTLTEQELQGFGVVSLFIKYTFNAGTAVAMSCTASDDAGTTTFALQVCETSSGTCTSYGASWSKAISAASHNWVWRIDVAALPRVTCTFTGTGTNANDKITVRGFAVAQ